MTCIVGIVSADGRIMMGADSAGVSGLDMRVRAPYSKLFRNGELLIGCTTSFRMIQLLQYDLTPPPVIEQQTPVQYVVRSLIPKIRQLFKEGGFARNEGGSEKGGTFLLGFRSNLFAIYDDYQVAQDQSAFASVGSGEQYAMGSLYTSNGVIPDDRTRLDLALNAAQTYNSGVRGPFNYLTLEAHKP